MAATECQAVAIIPARGGSKGIARKNLQQIGGKSLLARCIETCRAADMLDAVYVSTDCYEIAREAEQHGAEMIVRPPELATDTASTESVLLHAINMLDRDPQAICLVQCTSPLLASDEIDGTLLALHANPDADVAVHCVRTDALVCQQNCHWLVGAGHDLADPVLQRQTRTPMLLIAGTVWAINTRKFRQRGQLYSPHMVAHVTDGIRLEIDTISDLRMAERLLT